MHIIFNYFPRMITIAEEPAEASIIVINQVIERNRSYDRRRPKQHRRHKSQR
jgi:hypothetical protein